jgi:erythromycin esterase-like protein
MEALEALTAHLNRQTGRARIVVWEHNSHLGDARATDMSRRGEINVGPLVHQRYGREAVLVGFTTHHGTVSPASNWGGLVAQVCPAGAARQLRSAFHDADVARFILQWHETDEIFATLSVSRDSSALSASSIVLIPRGRATAFTRAWPSSSTRCSTSMRR